MQNPMMKEKLSNIHLAVINNLKIDGCDFYPSQGLFIIHLANKKCAKVVLNEDNTTSLTVFDSHNGNLHTHTFKDDHHLVLSDAITSLIQVFC